MVCFTCSLPDGANGVAMGLGYTFSLPDGVSAARGQCYVYLKSIRVCGILLLGKGLLYFQPTRCSLSLWYNNG